jgi:hypothetical protein
MLRKLERANLKLNAVQIGQLSAKQMRIDKLVPRDGLTAAFVTLTSDNPQCLQGSQKSKKAKKQKVTPYPQKQVEAPPGAKLGLRRGGRPRVENPLTPAQKMRAYRERQKLSDTPIQAAAE